MGDAQKAGQVSGLNKDLKREGATAMDNAFELSEQEKKYVEKINSLDFLNFLFNAINPNEMEQYISMYLFSGEKSLGNVNADMDT